MAHSNERAIIKFPMEETFIRTFLFSILINSVTTAKTLAFLLAFWGIPCEWLLKLSLLLIVTPISFLLFNLDFTWNVLFTHFQGTLRRKLIHAKRWQIVEVLKYILTVLASHSFQRFSASFLINSCRKIVVHLG